MSIGIFGLFFGVATPLYYLRPQAFWRSSMFWISFLSACLIVSVLAPAAAAAAVVTGVLFFVADRVRRRAALVLGLLCPLLPVFGDRTLLGAGLLFLAVVAGRPKLHTLAWAGPLLVLCGLWLAAEFLMGIPGSGPPGQVRDPFRWWEAFTMWRNVPPHWFRTAAEVSRMFLCVGLIQYFAEQQARRTLFVQGLILGLVPAALLAALQAAGMIPAAVLPNQSAYWNGLGRYAGTFTDPNAFGVFLVAALPLVLTSAYGASRRYTHFVAVFTLGWLALGVFSGSRSFVLGAIIYAGARLWQRSRLTAVAAAGSVAVVVLILNLSVHYRPASYQVMHDSVPVGLARVLESAVHDHWGEAFYSRSAFFSMAADMGRESPFIGKGFNQFENWMPFYAAARGLAIGTWLDNPNSFYLGILAELGLLGAAALLWLIAAWRLRPPEPGRPEVMSGVIALALVLAVGPHLDFDEVTTAAAVLFASVLTPRPTGRRDAAAILAVAFAFPLMLVKLSGAQYGLFPWEQGPGGRFRWTAVDAQIDWPCVSDGQVVLPLRVLHPDARARGVSVCVQPRGGAWSCRELHDAQLQRFPLQCGETILAAREFLCPVRLWVSRGWVPRQAGQGNDPRRLGVQLLEK